MLCREGEGRVAVLLGNVKSTGPWDSLRRDGREKEERKGRGGTEEGEDGALRYRDRDPDRGGLTACISKREMSN